MDLNRHCYLFIIVNFLLMTSVFSSGTTTKSVPIETTKVSTRATGGVTLSSIVNRNLTPTIYPKTQPIKNVIETTTASPVKAMASGREAQSKKSIKTTILKSNNTKLIHKSSTTQLSAVKNVTQIKPTSKASSLPTKNITKKRKPSKSKHKANKATKATKSTKSKTTPKHTTSKTTTVKQKPTKVKIAPKIKTTKITTETTTQPATRTSTPSSITSITKTTKTTKSTQIKKNSKPPPSKRVEIPPKTTRRHSILTTVKPNQLQQTPERLIPHPRSKIQTKVKHKETITFPSDYKLHTSPSDKEVMSRAASVARAEKLPAEKVEERTIEDEAAVPRNVASAPGTNFTASTQNGGIVLPKLGDSNNLFTASFLPTELIRNSTECEPESNNKCDVNNYERCSGKGRCTCLGGYLFSQADDKCVAAQFFRGEIAFANGFPESVNDKESEIYIKLTSELRQVLYSAFSSQGLTGILDISVASLSSESANVVFEVALNKNTAPRRQRLQTMYNRGLTATAYVDTDGFVKLSGTDLVLGKNVSMSQYLKLLTEYNHCVDAYHNYCDDNARCTHSMRTFSCRCEDGFDDMSPDIFKTPGEICRVSCQCKNNGSCENVDDAAVCTCADWFIGTNCEIDGKELLIICASVLGGLLILIFVLCCVCVCTMKNRSRKSSRSSTLGMGSSLDTSVVKLPRVWMDGSRPYDVPPSRDTRRWSYVSEPIRYIDDYMMDDYVHAETLPLPRHQDANQKRYYNAYQNTGYSSSTLGLSVARSQYHH